MRYNGNKFSVYESEEKTVLGLLDELGSQVNHNTDSLDSKTDLHGNHLGQWQGLSRPTLSEEGMRATVEGIIDNKIPSIETSLDNIAKISTDDLQNNINNYNTIYIDSDITINKEITIPSCKDIIFRNGARIIATIDGMSNVLKVKGDNIKIINAHIEYSVTSPSPHAGYGNAIVIGDYSSPVEIEYKNIDIINPTIKKNDNQHSVIAVYNSCNTINIKNPTIYNSALGILLHWGGIFDETEPHTSPASVSYHPHNIKITNYKYAGVGKPIHLASCFNVELDGLYAKNASTCVEIGVGDYANTIATPLQRNLVCKQLKIKNVYGYNIKGNAISVSGKGRRGGVEPDNILPSYNLEIENIVCEKGINTGNGAVIVVCNNYARGVNIKNVDGVGYNYSSHIYLQNCGDIKIEDCNFTLNSHNITLLDVDNIEIEKCRFKANANAINFSSTANIKCENVKVKNCVIDKSYHSFFIYNGHGVKIENCTFNDYKSNVIKFDGENSNITIKGCIFNKGQTPNISSQIELGKLQVANVYDNVFNLGDTKFNINILTNAYKCNIYNNISYGSTHTTSPMMIYQGTRTDITNTIFNNNTLNNFNAGTFSNYYTIDFIEK